MGLLYSLGLWLIGLDYALAVGVLFGVLVFVPSISVPSSACCWAPWPPGRSLATSLP